MNTMPYRLNQTQAMAFAGYKDTRAFGRWVQRNKVPYILEGKLKFFLTETLKRKMREEEEKFAKEEKEHVAV